MTESQLLGLAAEIIRYVKPSHNMGKTLRSIDSELHLQEWYVKAKNRTTLRMDNSNM